MCNTFAFHCTFNIRRMFVQALAIDPIKSNTWIFTPCDTARDSVDSPTIAAWIPFRLFFFLHLAHGFSLAELFSFSSMKIFFPPHTKLYCLSQFDLRCQRREQVAVVATSCTFFLKILIKHLKTNGCKQRSVRRVESRRPVESGSLE